MTEISQIIDYLKKDSRLFSSFPFSDYERLFRIKPYYETLIKTVISQRITLKHARTLNNRLGAGFSLQDIEEKDLSFLPKYKQDIIKRINAFIKTNNLYPLTNTTILQLKSVKGIGMWTLVTTLICANVYENLDLFPPGDVFLKRMIQRKYNTVAIDDIIKTWAPYTSVAVKILWLSM